MTEKKKPTEKEEKAAMLKEIHRHYFGPDVPLNLPQREQPEEPSRYTVRGILESYRRRAEKLNNKENL